MNPGVDQKKYIWIQDAAREYGRSRPWLNKQVDAGKLTYARFPGDQKVYLLRSELDALFSGPVIEERKKSQEDAG